MRLWCVESSKFPYECCRWPYGLRDCLSDSTLGCKRNRPPVDVRRNREYGSGPIYSYWYGNSLWSAKMERIRIQSHALANVRSLPRLSGSVGSCCGRSVGCVVVAGSAAIWGACAIRPPTATVVKGAASDRSLPLRMHGHLARHAGRSPRGGGHNLAEVALSPCLE